MAVRGGTVIGTQSGEDGIERQVSRGQPAELRRLRTDRAAWQARRAAGDALANSVRIDGLERCLTMFGLA